MNKPKNMRQSTSIMNNNILYTNNNKQYGKNKVTYMDTSNNIRKYQRVHTQGTEHYKISLNNQNQLNFILKTQKYQHNNNHYTNSNNNPNNHNNNNPNNHKQNNLYDNFNQYPNNKLKKYNCNSNINKNQNQNESNTTNNSNNFIQNNSQILKNNQISDQHNNKYLTKSNNMNKRQSNFTQISNTINNNNNNMNMNINNINLMNSNKKDKPINLRNYYINKLQKNSSNNPNSNNNNNININNNGYFYSGKRILNRNYKQTINNHNNTSMNFRQTQGQFFMNSTSFDYWSNNIRYTTLNNQHANQQLQQKNNNQYKQNQNQRKSQIQTKSFLNRNSYLNNKNQKKSKNIQQNKQKQQKINITTNNYTNNIKQNKSTQQTQNIQKIFKKTVQRVQTQPFFQKNNKIKQKDSFLTKQNQINFYQNFKQQSKDTSNSNNIKNQKVNKPTPVNIFKQTVEDKQRLIQAIDWKKDLNLFQKIGQGTFGKVYKACLKSKNPFEQNKLFAVKKVFIDKKYKSRQLQIVSLLKHSNVMKVYNVFTTSQRTQDQYLNIVMDHYPYNFYQVINMPQYDNINNKSRPSTQSSPNSKSSTMPSLRQKLYIYQMLKGLSYIHSNRICHRDIKPHNMLVKDWQLVLCDFGSAKKLIPGERNLSYICSRCYRAPQLIFGSSSYTTQIDLWSVGCIILEMLNKVPMFIGQNSLDHLLEVIKILGTPSKDEVIAMNPDYDLEDYQLPVIKRKNLSKIFTKADPFLLDLVNKLLVYSPSQRYTAIDALAHKYFDQIRQRQTFQQIVQKICQLLNGCLFFQLQLKRITAQ